jgi:hypothetical protein
MVRAMRKLIFLVALAPALASAQVQASGSFSINLPIILPQLVVVQPGIMVVPGLDVEVFQVDGVFWTQREGRWYRSRSHRGGWVHAPRGVPQGLARMPPGRYRHYRPAPPPPRAFDRGGRDRHDDRRDDQDRGRGHDDHGREKGDKHDNGKGHGKR